MVDFLATHHAAEHEERRQRCAQLAEPLAQLAAVIDLRVHAAATMRGALGLGVIVGRHLARHQPQHGVLVHIAQHLGRVVEEGVNQIRAQIVAQHLLQVAPGRLLAVGHAQLGHFVIGRKPHHAARNRRAAAEQRFLFDQQHPRALGGGDGCRRHAASAGATHDYVKIEGRLARHGASRRHHPALLSTPLIAAMTDWWSVIVASMRNWCSTMTLCATGSPPAMQSSGMTT